MPWQEMSPTSERKRFVDLAVLLRANPGAELPSISTFAVGRTRCHPLTVTDAFSRYLLACIALRSTSTNPLRRAFEQIFDAFGLPDAIRSDNGTPFASRSEPGKLQQNGRQERMHLTLKQEATSPAARSLRAQQAVFDRFRHQFNDERPHEAVGQKRPAEFYLASKRCLPDPPWRLRWLTNSSPSTGVTIPGDCASQTLSSVCFDHADRVSNSRSKCYPCRCPKAHRSWLTALALAAGRTRL